MLDGHIDVLEFPEDNVLPEFRLKVEVNLDDLPIAYLPRCGSLDHRVDDELTDIDHGIDPVIPVARRLPLERDHVIDPQTRQFLVDLVDFVLSPKTH